MLARPEKFRKKPSKKPQRGDVGTVPVGGMLPKSRAITVTRRAIIPSIAPSQKTSGRWPPETLQRALYIQCQVQSDEAKALILMAWPWRLAKRSPQASHSRMEEKTEEVETWPKLQSVRDIQMFLGFANFYKGLIRDFIESKHHLLWCVGTTDKSTRRWALEQLGREARCTRCW